jgi:hypothetical protein
MHECDDNPTHNFKNMEFESLKINSKYFSKFKIVKSLLSHANGA